MSNNNVVSREVDSWCRTKPTEMFKFKLAWTIEKFNETAAATDQSLRSSTFKKDQMGVKQTGGLCCVQKMSLTMPTNFFQFASIMKLMI